MESLAVKYRPKTFSDVVGQEKTIAILRNQIKTGETKQAYLFTGGAGTGKTTIARIFAREINRVPVDPNSPEKVAVCPRCGKYGEYLEEVQGNTVFKCTGCGHEFAEFECEFEPEMRDVGDLIEIDAASNNGVENVRDLRENCKFKPMQGGKRVYIIDEVHMLSTGAFNALLKTLEEPPAHAVFILCTTDPQKIPATILSRVQRFDFRRMEAREIISRLSQILGWENKADLVQPDALEYIAKLADGGMRDSISLLDTCLAYGTSLDSKAVANILGKADYAEFIGMAAKLYAKDAAGIIQAIEALHLEGKDLKQFIKGLAEFMVEMRKVLIIGKEHTNIPSMYFETIKETLGETDDLWYADTFTALVNLSNLIRYENHPKTLVLGVLLTL